MIMNIEVLLFVLVVAQVNCDCSMKNPCTPLKGDEQYSKKAQLVSSEGKLVTSLTVDINEFTFDWLTVRRRTYNGGFTGPTIRVKAGDRVNLNLVNNLKDPDFTDAKMNEFRFPNTTNLHTHGLHISSKSPQDDPFVRVLPETSHLYHYEIDGDQPAGTYWYHPHTHGSTHFQILSGMSGMLIVEDDVSEEIAQYSCPQNCNREVQIVFQSFQYANDDDAAFTSFQKDINDDKSNRLDDLILENNEGNLEEWLEDPTNGIRYVLVNGKLQPNLQFEAGKIHRFRFANAIGVHGLALNIESLQGDTCEIREVAVDGVYLPRPRKIRFGRSLVISGGRLDWLVVCNVPGSYSLKSTFKDSDFESLGDHPTFNGVLMKIDVTESTSEDEQIDLNLPQLPFFLSDLNKADDISGRFTVEVTPTDTMGREDYSGPNRVRTESQVNKVHEWNFVNTEYETSHPIHMHVNHMQVVSYNEYTGPVGVGNDDGEWKLFDRSGQTCTYQHQAYHDKIDVEYPAEALDFGDHHVKYHRRQSSFGYAQVGEWRDTLLVPPLGNITVRFLADKYVGDVIIHCHLTGDEDQGMMMVTRIIEGEPTSSKTAKELSGNAAPGSCMEDSQKENNRIYNYVMHYLNELKAALYGKE